LKTAPKDKKHELIDKAKKYFVTEIMKFDPEEMSLATVVFEGTKEEVAYQQKVLYAIAKKYKGFRAGTIPLTQHRS
jgi:alkyldihydroxyacetonephosphate synthase